MTTFVLLFLYLTRVGRTLGTYLEATKGAPKSSRNDIRFKGRMGGNFGTQGGPLMVSS